MMDINELSLEACGLLEKGGLISHYLAKDLNNLLIESTNETNYLYQVSCLVKEIRQDQTEYLDEWLLVEHFDDERLSELLNYVKSVQAIPARNRLYVNLPSETSSV
jgi:hypothetical protein